MFLVPLVDCYPYRGNALHAIWISSAASHRGLRATLLGWINTFRHTYGSLHLLDHGEKVPTRTSIFRVSMYRNIRVHGDYRRYPRLSPQVNPRDFSDGSACVRSRLFYCFML